MTSKDLDSDYGLLTVSGNRRDPTPIDRFQLVGTCLDDEFQIDRFVTEGGFAAVYAGRHLVLERAVAIKVLKTPAEYNDAARENFIAKFRLEAKIIARLSHPNIVQVIDFGVSKMPTGDEAPWMALEWLTGTSLEAELETRRGRGGRSGPEALALLEPIFDALAYAHEEGLAHRDVKPGNIMLVSSKRGQMPKLLDFGIVKVMDKGEAVEHSFMKTRGTLTSHTPGYAAPEQITGLRTGPWTDVHALALLLTEVMTDLPPYDGMSANTLLREILSPERPTPKRRHVDAGPWEEILTRALALDPAERYRDAGHFLVALKQAMPSAVQPIRTSLVPPVRNTTSDDGDYGRTYVRDSQPSPGDSGAESDDASVLASLPWQVARRKPVIKAAIAVAVLIAVIGGYFGIRSLTSPRGTTHPSATSDQPAREAKAPPPAAADIPSRRAMVAHDPSAPEAKPPPPPAADVSSRPAMAAHDPSAPETKSPSATSAGAPSRQSIATRDQAALEAQPPPPAPANSAAPVVAPSASGTPSSAGQPDVLKDGAERTLQAGQGKRHPAPHKSTQRSRIELE